MLYRLKGSRRLIRKMLGRYGVVTLTEARTKAREMLAQRALSNDPQAPEKARKVEDLRQSKILTVQKLTNQYLAALHRGAASDNVGQLLTARYIGDTVRHIACFTAGHAELEADTVTRANVLLLLIAMRTRPPSASNCTARFAACIPGLSSVNWCAPIPPSSSRQRPRTRAPVRCPSMTGARLARHHSDEPAVPGCHPHADGHGAAAQRGRPYAVGRD